MDWRCPGASSSPAAARVTPGPSGSATSSTPTKDSSRTKSAIRRERHRAVARDHVVMAALTENEASGDPGYDVATCRTARCCFRGQRVVGTVRVYRPEGDRLSDWAYHGERFSTSRRAKRLSPSSTILKCARWAISDRSPSTPRVPRRFQICTVRRLAAHDLKRRTYAAADGAARARRGRCRALLALIAPERNCAGACHDTDFAYEIPDLARFRANIFLDRKGPGAVFRVIPTKILTAEQLGLSQHLLQLCHLQKGLVLVTGPTGSGKSTTLCALIDYINRVRPDHIIIVDRVRAPESSVDQSARVRT